MHRTASVSDDDNRSTSAGGATIAPVPCNHVDLEPDSRPEAAMPAHSEMIGMQQMNNIGMLAAGLAHDMNNLLTVILGSAELARDALPAPSPARHHLRTIETAVRRAGEMCRSMLACARSDQHQPEAVEANALVRDTVNLLQSSRLALHRVRLDLASELPPLQANPAQLRQVVLNLLTNAAEACGPRDGRIRVSTTLAHVDARVARQLRPVEVPAGQFVRLRVADDGCGMDEETQQRLFTPFFTRKAQGRGLGLASLLEIARTHGGGVRVFSEPERGSIFDVFLPVSASAVTTPDSCASDAGTTAPAGVPGIRLQGTVLLADDEEILRQSLSAFLTTQGLIVQAVTDGEAALAQLAAPPGADLILIDLMMPKLGGLEVLSTLRARGDHTPVILMTGHADVAIAEQLSGMEPTVVLNKPFSLVELLQVIGELLPQRR